MTISLEQHRKLMEAFRRGLSPSCPDCLSRFDVKRTEGLIRAVCQGCGEIVRDNPQGFGMLSM